MVYHLLSMGAEINQRDVNGRTPLHRAAYLFHLEGYPQIYELLLSKGADPSIVTKSIIPPPEPTQLQREDALPCDLLARPEKDLAKLQALEAKYADTPKAREPHEDIGDFWALYDYGLETLKTWEKGYQHPYPEIKQREEAARIRKEKIAKLAKEGKIKTLAAPPPEDKAPVCLLFPGQGSQAAGMLKDLQSHPAVQKLVESANSILGYDLLDVCLNGPQAKLDDTVHAQPALFLAGMAALEKLKADDPAILARVGATAGLSLGEYTALCAAGVFSFEDGMRLVQVRATSMAAAAATGKPHGMLTVVGLPDADLEAICAQVTAGKEGAVCQVANLLFPQGRVLSGHRDLLEEAKAKATAMGALKAQEVAVSGGFHTPLMKSASEALGRAIASITLHDPAFPVYSNVTAAPMAKDDVPALLMRQLVEPVRWEDLVKALVGAGKVEMIELGPGAQLKAMTKRIDKDAWAKFKNVPA
eukprot:jgi/Mesvir1/12622/Mv09320-RA.3